MMNANFLYEVLTSTRKKIYLMQVQCKVQNAMHDDKQMFLDFLKIKEMQKEKEWLYGHETLQANIDSIQAKH